MRFLPLLWAGLWRKRTRTVFTLLSIVVAFVLFGMLQGVNAVFSNALNASAVDRLSVVSRVSFTEPLPFSYLTQIESLPGVAGVAYQSWFGTYYQDPKNFVFSFPLDPMRFFPLYPEFKVAPEELAALVRTRTGALVGRELAKKYGWQIGDRVPLHSVIWTQANGSSDWLFDIVGIYDAPADPNQAISFFFNHSYFDEARSFSKGTVGWYIVKVKNPARAMQVAAAIDQRFANSADETKTQSEKEFAQAFIKQQADISFIVSSILGAVFFTLLFLTGNTMMQSVRERVPELAVLKTLGFTDFAVVVLILAEALLLCIIAALIGLAIAACIFPALKSIIGEAHLPIGVVALGAAVAVLLALITGLPPAWRTTRLHIVDALAER
jgi:putative ABC transport system permease protein